MWTERALRVGLLGAALSLLGCGQVERSRPSSTRAAPETLGAIEVLRPENATPAGLDAPPRVTLAQRRPNGRLVPIRGEYLEAIEFRDGVAAVTLDRELQLLRSTGSRSLLANEVGGLPVVDGKGSLVYAARFGEVVELYRLDRDGTQRRLAALRGSATRLSPRSNGTVVFIGSELKGVSGIWIADARGARCLTNCDLRVGQPWGDSYRALPGETHTVRFVGSTIEWTTAEGRLESVSVTPSMVTR